MSRGRHGNLREVHFLRMMLWESSLNSERFGENREGEEGEEGKEEGKSGDDDGLPRGRNVNTLEDLGEYPRSSE